MSLFDYKESIKIFIHDYGFYSLIMAAMKKADDKNLWKLRAVFPEVWQELQNRYNAPSGILKDDKIS